MPNATIAPARMAPQLMRVPTEATSSIRGMLLAVVIGCSRSVSVPVAQLPPVHDFVRRHNRSISETRSRERGTPK
jgi:hypothetical protein